MIRSRKKKALELKMREKQELTCEEEKKLLASYADDAGKKSDDPFKRTGRLFGSMINDLKRRLPLYKSDIQDGLNSETLAATTFLYFAALATAVTFGGLIGSKTDGLIGISETLVSASFVGMVFHSLASQPLVFVGTTGPLILFDEALIQFCNSMGFSFLTVRVYVGMWLSVIALAVSAFEGSVFVRLFTRFTQEIFSAVITRKLYFCFEIIAMSSSFIYFFPIVIYIVETALKLIVTYQRHPLLAEYQYKNTTVVSFFTTNQTLEDLIEKVDGPVENISNVAVSAVQRTLNGLQGVATTFDSERLNLLMPSDKNGPINQPNTALFCTGLTLGTFLLAYTLKIFRNSKFLGRNSRRALGDFGVPISIAFFVMIDYMLPQVYTDKLNVPDGISPSDPSRRGWIIPFGPVPIWLPFASLVPALLVYILIFMETQISELIVGKPERGLKKGNGLHWDINLLCFCNSVCGIFGFPWHCAATVRSVTHVSAVTM